MTTHVVFHREGASSYLLECWLGQLPVDARVALLHTDHGEAQSIIGRARQVHVEPVLIPESGLPLPDTLVETISSPGASRVYVPLSLARIPLQFRSNTLIPDLAPHYGLLRRLWQWGFREVVFVDHGGETVVPMPHLLDGFHNCHRGQRCFVVGNGPSLNHIDMTRLSGEITLGSNRCFLGYPAWGFPFTYWGVYDAFQIEEYHAVYQASVPADTVKFFPAEYRPLLRVDQGCMVNSMWPDRSPRLFSDEPGQVYRGFTVTCMLLQIAAIMGCDPIILIGVDHRYGLKGRGYSRFIRSIRRRTVRHFRGGRLYEAALAAHRSWRQTGSASAPSLWTSSDAASPTHFTAQYTDGGKNKFLPPEPEEAERDFACARAWADRNNRQILNATPDSALTQFTRVGFESLF